VDGAPVAWVAADASPDLATLLELPRGLLRQCLADDRGLPVRRKDVSAAYAIALWGTPFDDVYSERAVTVEGMEYCK
jgi:hypothetical protein